MNILHKSKFLTQNFLTIPNTGLCISSGILVFPLFLGVRTSQRGGSLKRIENSAFREPVTEASLISFAGGSRGRREKSRCPFPFTRLGTELTPPAALVLARTSEPQSFSIPEPLNDSAEGHQTVRSIARRFQTRSGPPEGGWMSRFFFLHFDATRREIRLV